MKKRNWILMVIILIFLGLQPTSAKAATNNITTEQEAFILSIKDEAIKSYKNYGVLPSLTISQAILESSWGNSKLSLSSNNLFGIKAYDDWTGSVIKIPTKEYINGSYVYINANFKAYSSVSESILDHSKLLSNDNYSSVISATNYHDACYAIYKCGYATAPNYSKMLIKIIESYNLSKYDIMPEEPIQEEPKSPLVVTLDIPSSEKVIIDLTESNTEDKNNDSSVNINHFIMPLYKSDNWYITHSMIYKTATYTF